LGEEEQKKTCYSMPNGTLCWYRLLYINQKNLVFWGEGSKFLVFKGFLFFLDCCSVQIRPDKISIQEKYLVHHSLCYIFCKL